MDITITCKAFEASRCHKLLPHWFWGLARSYPKGNRITFSWSFSGLDTWEVSGIHADERLNHEIFELFWIRQGKSFITLFSILWHFIIPGEFKVQIFCKFFTSSLFEVFGFRLQSGDCSKLAKLDFEIPNLTALTWGKSYYKAILNCQKSVCLQ